MIDAGKYGMNNSNKKKQMCETCVETRSMKVTCKGNLVERSRAITMPADVCGPMQHQCFGRSKYFVVMIVTPHRYVRVRLMKFRTELQEHCLEFMACINRNSRKMVKAVHADNATEFLAPCKP